MFFYTPEEVRRIEKNETENGLSSLEMIENAAAALYDRFKECFEANRKPMRVLVLCGKGNNGADGYAFAKLLKKDGIFTEILSVNTGTQSRENRFFSPGHADHKRYLRLCRLGLSIGAAVCHTLRPRHTRNR